MIPIEGIDKIKVLLHPLWYTPDLWKYTQPEKSKSRIDPNNHLTLHQSGMFVSLAIHAEFCDPWVIDYRVNIANAIYECIKKGILAFPDWPPFTLMFVFANLNRFIYGIQEVEFYFDMRPQNITVDKSAVESGCLHEYKGTLYTRDYRNGKNKRKSIGIIYDKAAKNFKDNHIEHAIIKQYPYKTRLEFRLTNRNCQYLNLENLRGNYVEIIKHFTPYLAIQLSRWFGDYIGISGRDNKKLKVIVRKSKDCGSRYRGDELKKSSVIRVEEKARDNKGREQMQRMMRRQFYREQWEAETGQK
jgi:hypothetical protein